MGKKSKLYKRGLPRTQIKKPLDSKLKKIIANLPPSSSENQEKPSQKVQSLPKINYNLAIKKDSYFIKALNALGNCYNAINPVNYNNLH